MSAMVQDWERDSYEESERRYREMSTQLEDILNRIRALAENPHWTSDRRWRIAELTEEGFKAIRRTSDSPAEGRGEE